MKNSNDYFVILSKGYAYGVYEEQTIEYKKKGIQVSYRGTILFYLPYKDIERIEL